MSSTCFTPTPPVYPVQSSISVVNKRRLVARFFIFKPVANQPKLTYLRILCPDKCGFFDNSVVIFVDSFRCTSMNPKHGD